MFRDNLVHTLLRQQGLDTSQYQPYQVYLDGEYWGIHILQENMEEHYILNHYNLPLSALILESESHAICGSDDDYESFVAWLQANNPNDPTVWQTVQQKIDLTNCTEYFAGEIIAGNDSWPSHNIRYWRKNYPIPHPRLMVMMAVTDGSFMTWIIASACAIIPAGLMRPSGMPLIPMKAGGLNYYACY